MDYCELILCTISNSANFNHHCSNRHNQTSLIRHIICDFVNNVFHTQFMVKIMAFCVSVVAVQVCVTVIKGKCTDLDFTW
jgi:hypothetical protein